MPLFGPKQDIPKKESKMLHKRLLYQASTLVLVLTCAAGMVNAFDHYCPAKISEGHPNPLKISVITHARSENDLN